MRRFAAIAALHLVVGCNPDSQEDAAVFEFAGNPAQRAGHAGQDAGLFESWEQARRAEATARHRPMFTSSAVRWPCADVHGVFGNDRGQELCEYRAIVAVPAPDGSTNIADTDLSSVVYENEEALHQLDYDTVVGQCLFTTHHKAPDDTVELAITPTLTFKTRAPSVAQPYNTKSRLETIWDLCGTPGYQFADKRAHAMTTEADAFRGAFATVLDQALASGLWDSPGTFEAYRRADTLVCTAARKFSQCGCAVDGMTSLAAVFPGMTNGLPLGSWADSSGFAPFLPCRHVDAQKTVVACDITVGHLILNAADMPEFCRDKFGAEVVVHLPMPAGIQCKPPAEHVAHCGAAPWTNLAGNGQDFIAPQ